MSVFLVCMPHSIAISPVRKLVAARKIVSRLPSLCMLVSPHLAIHAEKYDWPQASSGMCRETPRGVLSRDLKENLTEIRQRLHALEKICDIQEEKAEMMAVSDYCYMEADLMASLRDDEVEAVARIRSITPEEVRFHAASTYEKCRAARITNAAIMDLCADEIAFCAIEDLSLVTQKCEEVVSWCPNIREARAYADELVNNYKLRWEGFRDDR